MSAAKGRRVAGIGERRIFISYRALDHAPTADLRTLEAALREHSRNGAPGTAARKFYVQVQAELMRRASGRDAT